MLNIISIYSILSKTNIVFVFINKWDDDDGDEVDVQDGMVATSKPNIQPKDVC